MHDLTELYPKREAEQVVGMTFKVRRLTPKARENIRRGLRNSWQPGGAHHARFRSREPDADTLRKRALHDRRGTYYATISMPGGTFILLWSTGGRTDQVDIFNDGKLVETCRPSLALERIARKVGKC